MNLGKVFKNGIIDENPTFVQVIGMCPTLAVTSAAINGLGMGLSTTVVLACSNVAISLLRKVIPDKIRIPAFVVVIATFVTIVQMLLKAYIPSLEFTLALTILGAVREILGAGAIFGVSLFGASYQPALLFILPPGAFLTLGILMAIFNKVTKKSA